MGFTEQDAENDGKIKREVGQQLASVLGRKNSELYRKFLEYCDNYGYDPSTKLGSLALRAMKDDGVAEAIATTTVNVGKLKIGQVRQEDLDMVLDLVDKIDDSDDGGKDFVDEIVEKRMSALGSGPLGGLTEKREGGGGGSVDEVRRLEAKIDELQQKIDSAEKDTQETEEEPNKVIDVRGEAEDEQDEIDSLFDDDNDEQEIQDDEQQDEVVEVDGVEEETEEETDEVEEVEFVNNGISDGDEENPMVGTFSTEEAEHE